MKGGIILNTKELKIGQVVYDCVFMSPLDVEFYPVEILEIINSDKIKVIEHGLPNYWNIDKIRILNKWYLKPTIDEFLNKKILK